MKRHALALLPMLLGCSTPPSHVEQPDPLDPNSFREYSSTVTVETGGRKNVFQYYREGSKLRIVPVPPNGMPPEQGAAILVDEDQKTVTVLSLATHQYSVRPLRDGPDVVPGQRHNLVSSEPLGSETISGRTALLQRVVAKSPLGSEHTLKVWSAPDLDGFPVKIESTRAGVPVTTTFADVKLGALHDPSLFAIPSGFVKAGG